VHLRKKNVLIALAIIAIGFVGTGLTTLYKQHEYIDFTGRQATYKESYGFPLGWYGYSYIVGGVPILSPIHVYWFSLLSLLLDAAFWVVISSIGCIAIIRSMNMLHKARASKNLSVINI
jgi:hypothetical protein